MMFKSHTYNPVQFLKSTYHRHQSCICSTASLSRLLSPDRRPSPASRSRKAHSRVSALAVILFFLLFRRSIRHLPPDRRAVLAAALVPLRPGRGRVSPDRHHLPRRRPVRARGVQLLAPAADADESGLAVAGPGRRLRGYQHVRHPRRQPHPPHPPEPARH